MSAILAAGGDGGTVTQVFSGLAALLAAFGAYRLNQRDNDAEDFKKLKQDHRALSDKFDDVKDDLVTMRNYTFQIRSDAAAQGVPVPEPPHLKSEDW